MAGLGRSHADGQLRDMVQMRDRAGSNPEGMRRHSQQRKSCPTGTKAPKFVVSRPIRAIMHSPLQLKVLVPRSGRSVEHQLSKAMATGNTDSEKVQRGQDDSGRVLGLKAAAQSIFVSVQAQQAINDACIAGMSAHVHFDLVLRLRDTIGAAHMLCKVVYHNVRGEVKEMGPYLLHMTENITSYRLEEMNCHVSGKTGHHHVYLLLELVSAESPKDQPMEEDELQLQQPQQQQQQLALAQRGDSVDELDGERPLAGADARRRLASGGSLGSLLDESPSCGGLVPSHSCLPDFSVVWSPLATLKIVASSCEQGRELHCVPQLLCLTCDGFRELLQDRDSFSGELVLTNTTHADLLLLLQLTHPGTPCTVNLGNVQQVLRVASRFKATALLRTAEQLLQDRCSQPMRQQRRLELSSLATQFGLLALKERLGKLPE